MKLYGPLEVAAIESLATDPTTSVAGRIYWNTTNLQFMLDSGTSKRALIRNDGKAIFGTDQAAANNIRLHRAGPSYLQFVTADDTTAEGAISSKLAQVGIRFPNFATTALPAAGNVGRVVFDTTTGTLKVDNGTAYQQLAQLTGTAFETVAFNNQTATPSTPSSGTKIYAKNGALYKLATDGVESIVGAGGGTSNFVNKTASYTAAPTDGVAFVSAATAAVTVTLPDATTNAGVRLTFVKNDTSGNIISLGTVTTVNGQGDQVTLLSNGTSWIVVDRVLTPMSASYYMNTIQGLSVGSVIKWDTKWDANSDPLGLYSTSTGLFRAPATGFYTLMIGLYPDGNGTNFLIKVNGVNSRILGSGSGGAFGNASRTMYLTAGSTVGVYSFAGAACNIMGKDATNGVPNEATFFRVA